MKKINFILILVISFAFFGCGERLIDMDVTSCTLDKEVYKLNEDIVFSCNGYFNDCQDLTGDLGIEIIFSKKIDGDAEQKLSFEIIDSGKLNIEIQELLEQHFGIKHSVEYISSLWRNKIPKMIAEQAKEDYIMSFGKIFSPSDITFMG